MDECAKQNVEFIKLNYIIRKAASNGIDQLGEYGEYNIDWIGCADDLAVAFKDKKSIEKSTAILNPVLRRFKLAINEGKTKNNDL